MGASTGGGACLSAARADANMVVVSELWIGMRRAVILGGGGGGGGGGGAKWEGGKDVFRIGRLDN